MFPTKLLLVALALWLSMFNYNFEASGDVKCEYPCQPPSPPLPGYSYGAPPPPPPSPPPSGYSIYGAPPPPPHEKGQSKCPPSAGVECCTPPVPYTYFPPNPYTYVPYGEGQASPSRTLLPVLVLLMMLSSSFIFLF